MTLTTREDAWVQLHDAMHDQLNLPRVQWPADLDERIASANTFLDENPAPKEGHGAPVTITLSPASMKQIRDELTPIKEVADRLSKAVDLLDELANAGELWTALFSESAKFLDADGNEIEFTPAERSWMRDVLGRILMFGGREDNLPTVEYDEPVGTSTDEPIVRGPEVIAVGPDEAVVVIKEAAPETTPAKSREARNPAWAAMQDEQPPRTPTTPGVEVWDGAPEHDCRAELDVDDVCTVCGNHVPTGPGANRG